MHYKQRIDVSPEMVTFVGGNLAPTGAWPEDAICLTFDVAGAICALDTLPTDEDVMTVPDIVLIIARATCRRLFGILPGVARWHLPSELRAVVNALLGCRFEGEAGAALRGAKSIELLCMTFEAMADERLVSAEGAGDLSEMDTRRIIAARQLIDDRWREKLTLDSIARACGINRAKLTRGFRSMFAMTVADAIAERRLGGAGEMLRGTDLPVSSIGYACGYLNNASFTRAFSRRFGVAPTLYRAHRIAA